MQALLQLCNQVPYTHNRSNVQSHCLVIVKTSFQSLSAVRTQHRQHIIFVKVNSTLMAGPGCMHWLQEGVA